MVNSENKDTATMCEVYKAEAEALRNALKSGDWSDKGEKFEVNTNRTESTIELVEKIEDLQYRLGHAVTALRYVARQAATLQGAKDTATIALAIVEEKDLK